MRRILRLALLNSTKTILSKMWSRGNRIMMILLTSLPTKGLSWWSNRSKKMNKKKTNSGKEKIRCFRTSAQRYIRKLKKKVRKAPFSLEMTQSNLRSNFPKSSYREMSIHLSIRERWDKLSCQKESLLLMIMIKLLLSVRTNKKKESLPSVIKTKQSQIDYNDIRIIKWL